MPKTGRPKLDPSARKAGFITLRMSDDERSLIDQAAEKEGKRATSWAREILLAKAGKLVA